MPYFTANKEILEDYKKSKNKEMRCSKCKKKIKVNQNFVYTQNGEIEHWICAYGENN